MLKIIQIPVGGGASFGLVASDTSAAACRFGNFFRQRGKAAALVHAAPLSDLGSLCQRDLPMVRKEFEAISVAALVNLLASPMLRGRTSELVAPQEKSTIALSVVASATILLLRGCRSSSAVLTLLILVLLMMLLPNGTPGLPADWDPTALSSSIMCVPELISYVSTLTTVEAGVSWVRHSCSTHESKPMVPTLLFRMPSLPLLPLLPLLSLLPLLLLLPFL